jgi:hypothetical protein
MLKLTEAAFLKQVLEYATLKGWRTAHFRPGMTKRGTWVTAVQGDGKGFPDLLLIRGKRIVVAELKVGANKPTSEQEQWLTAFLDAGVESYVWYPVDFDEILEVLG